MLYQKEIPQKHTADIFIAGGGAAGVAAAMKIKSGETYVFPRNMMIGAMAHYVAEGGVSAFQPMNANFGIIPNLEQKVKGGKKARYEAYAVRALAECDKVAEELREMRLGKEAE